MDRSDRLRVDELVARAAGLHPVFRLYVRQMLDSGRSLSAVQNVVRGAETFERFLAERGGTVEGASPDDVRQFLAHARDGEGRELASSTRHLYGTAVRAAYRRAVERWEWEPDAEGAVRRTPFVSTVELPSARPAEAELVPVGELVGMLPWADREGWRAGLLARLLMFTGMRRVEIASLAWDEVDFAARTVTVVGKGGYPRTIPVHSALWAAMLAVADSEGRRGEDREGPVIWRSNIGQGGAALYGAAYSTNGLDYLAKRFTDRKLHSFRKTVATELHKAGVAESLVFDLLGWTKQTMFGKYYYRPSDDVRAAAVERLYEGTAVAEAARTIGWRDDVGSQQAA